MPRPLAATTLLAMLALAGCSGGDAGDRDPMPSAATGLAGTTGATGDAQVPNGTAPAATQPVWTPIAIDGSTAAGGCVAAAGEEQCHYEMTETAFHELDAPGRPLRLVGNLTWSAVGPSSETLTLYVPEVRSDGFHWEPGHPSASGTSPLAFDLDLGVLGDARPGLIVGNGVVQPFAVGYAAVQTPQEFVLEARLLTSG